MKDYKFDPSLNILYKESNNLDYFFYPKTVAVIGASERENSVGRVLFENLINEKNDIEIFAINPKRDKILGYKSYKSIKDIDKKIDLVVIATPAKIVPSIVQECEEARVHAAVIVSAGFKESGEKGLSLEKEIKKNKKKVRIIGPNCLGVMNPWVNLNATFAAKDAMKGNIAFISQSGALGTAVLDWSIKEKIGFSAFVSIGSMIDVNWGDLINYFGNDKNTRCILMYMENISEPRNFLSTAREVALTKPIILIKAGKTQESAKAAKSHTGALIGSDEVVLNAALKRVGVLRVDSIEELFSMAEILSKQPLAKGPHLAIVTNAGGPGVIATDSLILSNAKLAKLQEQTMEELNSFLPSAWSHNNPVDILGDATAELYEKTIKALMKDSKVDGILAILTPQFMTNPTQVAKIMKNFHNEKKPIFGSWMGADSVQEGRDILASFNIADFEYPDLACAAFANMWSYSENLKEIYETHKPSKKASLLANNENQSKIVSEIISNALGEKRVILTEEESKDILNAYQIPAVQAFIAKNEKQAVELAKKIGFSVVLKLYSKNITHKSDVEGVKLNLKTEKEVKEAFKEIYQSLLDRGLERDFDGVSVQSMIKQKGYELILGSFVDSQFGPAILFGSGGELVEVINDKAISLPPLTKNLAMKMIKKTKIYNALKGFRDKKAIDFEKLSDILINFSNLLSAHPQIKECDINPILASDNGIIALDARIILYEPNVNPIKQAIRAYPSIYVQDIELKNKEKITIRPIHPEDENDIKDFYKEVSQKSLRERYLKTLHYDELIAHERLIRICYIDYDREITLVAKDSKNAIAAIARFSKIKDSNDAFFSLLVKDSWHNKGLGTKLLESIISIARAEKIDYLISQMFEDNHSMEVLCKKLNFTIVPILNTNIVELSLKI
jgi:acetyltransferase